MHDVGWIDHIQRGSSKGASQLSALSIFIGLLAFLCFLYIEIAKSSLGIPRLRKHGCDFFVVFLFLGDSAQYYLLNTGRTDALAILTGDFNVGNISAAIWTTAAALYLGFVLLVGRFRIEWFFRAPYLSIFVMILLYLASSTWSIVPLFTLYRACELAVWVGLSVYFFTRLDSLFSTVLFLSVYCTTWVVLNFPVLAESLSQGIVFSAIKDNFLPAVGFCVAVLGWGTRFRFWFCVLGMIIFVLAGSAAAVPCAIAACFVGLAFNRNVIFKLVGCVGFLSALACMIAYLWAPEEFMGLIDFVSGILQKPTAEFLTATGRYTIWSIIWDATKDDYFGLGFGSDRFIQLLGGMAEVNARFGSPIIVMSAHDAALSAWTATGWLGVVALFFVYVAGIRYCSYDGAAATMAVTFIILDGLAVPGLAGFFSPVWLTWIAVHSTVATEKSSESVLFKIVSPELPQNADNGHDHAAAI